MKHVDDLLELPGLDLLLIDHLPQTIHKFGFLLQPIIFKLPPLEPLLSGLNALDNLEDLGGVEDGDAGLDIDDVFVLEVRELLIEFIDENEVAVVVDFLGGRHQPDLLLFLLLQQGLVLLLPFRLLV